MYRKILVNVQKVILDYIVNFVSKTNNDWNLNIIYNEYVFFFFFSKMCNTLFKWRKMQRE